jgi:hypothetical protein
MGGARPCDAPQKTAPGSIEPGITGRYELSRTKRAIEGSTNAAYGSRSLERIGFAVRWWREEAQERVLDECQ